jgi:TolA-binding protein
MNEPRDLLDEAISAYSDSADSALGESDSRVAMATRGRVLAELRAKEQRSRKFRFWGIPVALGLVGSTTWAAESPWVQELSTVVASKAAEWSARALGTQSAAPRPRPAQRSQKPVPEPAAASLAAPAAAPHPAPASPEVAPPSPALAPSPALPVTASRPKPIHVASSTRQAHALEVDQENTERIPSGLADYELAHRLHFRQGDCAGAVAAYRRYIHSFPAGAFVLEAEYNLGLCLSRLGQTDEAVRVLTPFASGARGSYRQKESQAVVDALQGQAPARE